MAFWSLNSERNNIIHFAQDMYKGLADRSNACIHALLLLCYKHYLGPSLNGLNLCTFWFSMTNYVYLRYIIYWAGTKRRSRLSHCILEPDVYCVYLVTREWSDETYNLVITPGIWNLPFSLQQVKITVLLAIRIYFIIYSSLSG